MNGEQRRATNETLFREINERIETVAEDIFDEPASEPRVWEFVCECSRQDCTEKIPLTTVEYEGVRVNGRRFFVLPEHADLSIERVVDRSSRYWIVEKTGEAADIAEEEDPRSSGAS